MEISWNQIKNFLNNEQISFTLINVPARESFLIASLFSSVNEGFYFYTGINPFNKSIKNSVVLVNSDNVITDLNCYIVIENQDVQLIYYKILTTYFKRLSNGKISKLSEINPNAELGENVQIDSFCSIGKATIGSNCIIGSNCVIHDNVQIDNNTIIESGSVVGTQGVAWIWGEDEIKIIQPQLGGVTIGSNCFLGSQTIIVRGSLNEKTTIENNVMLAPGCRLGHGTTIKRNAHLANSVVTGGNVTLGENAFIGSGAIFRPKVQIHENTIVAAGAVVVNNTTEPNKTLIGCPAQETQTKVAPSGMPKPLNLK